MHLLSVRGALLKREFETKDMEESCGKYKMWPTLVYGKDSQFSQRSFSRCTSYWYIGGEWFHQCTEIQRHNQEIHRDFKLYINIKSRSKSPGSSIFPQLLDQHWIKSRTAILVISSLNQNVSEGVRY